MDWSDFDTTVHQLKRPLLVVSGSKGCLSCGYLNIASFERNGDAGAIVRGVDTFDDMLEAEVQQVSPQAEALGVKIGMKGRDALELFR
jgi:uncharacterized protein YunC (DUF1805 family)